jgi:TRAP-type C4-dicarboxylate transport system permease large subunit
MMVVYGGLTGLKETSVGNLFAGAIFPGLILAGALFYLHFDPLQHQPGTGPPHFQG